MTDETTEKRGSRGGQRRAEKLSKEERRRIASEAARARWDAKRKADAEKANPTPAIESAPTPEIPEEKHCPACLAGESLEEGEGTHILATVEHPVDLPAAFREPEASVVAPEPPVAPQKPAKRQNKAMPKEFKTASSYAEKRLPLAIKEKSDHVGAVARLDAEINDLVRVIKALGGTVDPQATQMPSYPQPMPYQQPYVPAGQPAYLPPAQAAATPVDIPPAPRPMRAGRAGVADAVISEFQREIAEG